jgi:TM2 domain-containing membrane protein YozV
LYRSLPGGRIAKALQMFVILAGLVGLLFLVIFPYVDSLIPEDPALDV